MEPSGKPILYPGGAQVHEDHIVWCSLELCHFVAPHETCEPSTPIFPAPSSDTHILCAAGRRLPTGLSVPTAAAAPGLCLAVPSPGTPPLPCHLPSWTSLDPVLVLGYQSASKAAPGVC